MINLFEVIVNIVEQSINMLFLSLYFGCRYSGIKKIGGFVLWTTISVCSLTFLNSLYIYEGILGLIFTIIFFGYSFTCLKGDVYIKLFISGFLNSMIYFIALFGPLCISILSGEHNSELYNMTNERVILIVFCKVLQILSCAILLKFKFPYVANQRNMIPLICIPIVSEISITGIMQVFLNHSELKHELFIASIGVLLANILIYYIFIKTNNDIKTVTELNSALQKYESDRKYAEDIKELYAKTCSIRHDLVTHFSTLSGLLSEDNTKALEYINTVTENQLKKIKSFIKTDNDCFDAITNAKIAVCEKHGIYVETRVMNNSLQRLESAEIAVIFGNLFDNAIEAAKDTNDKIIELDIYKKDEQLIISMSNTISKSVLNDNVELKTTKKDKEYHGYGIKNIKRIVEKYNGFMNHTEKNNRFICEIFI